MRNLKLTLQYDGTDYHGFQIQPEAITVQGVVENALSDITGENIHINGCSRTDAKVHAIKYVCSFNTNFPIPANRLTIVLNNKLPKSIRIICCEEVNADFHARFDTSAKTYRYVINTSETPDLFARNYEWQIGKFLDVSKMRKSCKYIIGTHDFRCFMTSGTDVISTVRTVYELKIKKKSNIITIYIKADGYLYNMVRIITGTLVNVGLNKFSPDYIKEIIDGKLRENAGPTAPPQGLSLYDVEY